MQKLIQSPRFHETGKPKPRKSAEGHTEKLKTVFTHPKGTPVVSEQIILERDTLAVMVILLGNLLGM
jgi:hypothetical protein